MGSGRLGLVSLWSFTNFVYFFKSKDVRFSPPGSTSIGGALAYVSSALIVRPQEREPNEFSNSSCPE